MFLVLGIALVVLGSVAIGWACLSTITIAATWIFGFVLLGGGIGEIIHSFTVGRWSGTLVHLHIGVLYCVVGFMMISDPADSAITLTKIIAIFMIVGGIFRVVAALSHRFPGWEWVLLNGGVIEQQGTPQEMYSQPQTHFVADFMVSHNTLKGHIADIRDDEACVEIGDGLRLWGRRRSDAAFGQEVTAVIRVEQARLADGPGEHRTQIDLTTSMFLGDRFEYVLHAGGNLLRAWGNRHENAGKRWLEFPPEAVWVF